MPYFRSAAAIMLAIATTSCASNNMDRGSYGVSKDNPTSDPFLARRRTTLDPSRVISERDCAQPFAYDGGNLRCM